VRVAVLAVAQQMQPRQAAPVQPRDDAHRAVHRPRGLREGHELPAGAVGVGALAGESELQVLALHAGMAVLDLVSSHTSSHGQAAWAACSAGSVLYWA
jgi:hypothetical protein